MISNNAFQELTLDDQMQINAGGFWGGVVTGLSTVGAVALAVAFAPEVAVVGTAVVTGYYISTGLTAAGGAVATYLAAKS